MDRSRAVIDPIVARIARKKMSRCGLISLAAAFGVLAACGTSTVVDAQGVSEATSQQVFVASKDSTSIPFRWGAPSGGLEFGIAVVQTVYKAGSPIQVWFGIRNLTPQTLSFFRVGDFADYDVTLQNSTDAILPQIKGSAYAEFDGSIHPSYSLNPGATFIYRVMNLNDFYELKPEKYIISATTSLSKDWQAKRAGNVYLKLRSGVSGFAVTAPQ
jgi:hypothetical protein